MGLAAQGARLEALVATDASGVLDALLQARSKSLGPVCESLESSACTSDVAVMPSSLECSLHMDAQELAAAGSATTSASPSRASGSEGKEPSGSGHEMSGEDVKAGRGGEENREGLTSDKAEPRNDRSKANGSDGSSTEKQDLCSELTPGHVLSSGSVVCKSRSVPRKSKGEGIVTRDGPSSVKSSLKVSEAPQSKNEKQANSKRSYA